MIDPSENRPSDSNPFPGTTIARYDEPRIDAALDREIRRFLCEYFPNWAEIFRVRRAWHDAPPIYTELATETESGRIVGHVAVVERTITTEWNWRYSVASIQGVSVAVDRRKTGLSTELLDRAVDEARRRGYPFAVLFCREPLVRFYESNGWRLPDDSMTMWRDRELPIHMRSNCPMYRTLADVPFPEGPIDVHNPF